MSQTPEATLEKIVNLFSTNDLPTLIRKTYIENIGKPSSNWSLGNQLIQMIVGETNDARTFNQWNKVGRYVKKGSKAFHILAPIQFKTIKVNKETQEQKEVYVLGGFRGIPVFKMEDTDGAGLKTYEPKTILPLKQVAETWGITVQYNQSMRGEYGYFDPKNKVILLDHLL